MDREEAARLRARLAEAEEAIRTLEARLAAKQDELDRIRATRGYRLLTRYGAVKYRYLLPLLRRLRAAAGRPSPARVPAPELSARAASDPELRQAAAVPRRAGADARDGRGGRAPRDVVCLSIADCDAGLVQRSQHLQAALAGGGHRVFHVRPSFRAAGAPAELDRVAERFFAIRLPGPRWLDSARSALEGEALDAALEALGAVAAEAGIEGALCWVELPFWAPLAVAARERFGWSVVYDCMDDHAQFSTTGEAMLRHEAALVAASALVVASSRALHDRLAPRARRALLLPNATEFAHWARALEPPALDPLRGVAPPVIGYFGTIAEWLDVDAILDAAARRPAWQFVLIGEVIGIDERPLRARPNVRLLGREPYAALPDFLARFDVACIPFRSTPLTRAVDPVKFYEYLSAGKPVVATALPELLPHRDLFYPVESAAELVPQIEAALAEASAPDRAARVRARLEFARHNDWSARYRALEEALGALAGGPAAASQARDA